jgi:hypothetical protein
MNSLRSGRGLFALTLASFAAAFGVVDIASAAPTAQFSVNGSTVMDLRTNLEWQRGELAAGDLAYSAAGASCAALGTGWRLPTALELLSIVDERRAGNMHDPAIFTSGSAVTFWTTSNYATNAFYVVDMANGQTTLTDMTSGMHHARCVR